jgi:dihydroorotate dehydrogenase (NAD+) catalytic subunit
MSFANTPEPAKPMQRTYDIQASYQENYDAGPRFSSVPPTVPETPLKDFLGLPVRSRIGIAAGLLLNSKWVLGYAKRGFDILTYKTVRSAHRPCYPKPNWLFVDDAGRIDGPVQTIAVPPANPARVSSAVCFGMPSMDPAIWREDVARTKSGLADGQILIVSVVATPQDGWGREEVAEDFAKCARWAAEAGADVVEANFSCPNVCTPEGTIYQDTDLSRFIAAETRAAIGETPLLLKVGHFPQPERLREFLRSMSGVVNGLTLVNGISRPVLNADGSAAFGESYRTAGVLGRAIHQPSVDNVALAASTVRDERLGLAIAAVGGVSQPSDAADFFDAGADAVMLGSSPMYLPDLAADLKITRPDW